MEKVRQDAWSHEDDLMLAETVLRQIREGGTQLKAFEEVGDRLNRTAAACGFRWNAEIRQKYIQAIEIAKKQRKERKRAFASKMMNNQMQIEQEDQEWDEVNIDMEDMQDTNVVAEEITLDAVITFLQDYNKKSNNSEQLQNENERLMKENQQLMTEKDRLEKKLQRMNERREMIQEDYQSLIQIMDRARRMVLFDGSESQLPSSFLNNNNDNLEQMAE